MLSVNPASLRTVSATESAPHAVGPVRLAKAISSKSQRPGRRSFRERKNVQLCRKFEHAKRVLLLKRRAPQVIVWAYAGLV